MVAHSIVNTGNWLREFVTRYGCVVLLLNIGRIMPTMIGATRSSYE